MIWTAITALVVMIVVLGPAAFAGSLEEDFANPPLKWKSRPLWFWNGPATDAQTRSIMEASKAIGYAGFGILPAHDKQAFMTPAFLDDYAYAMDMAAELGLKMCLYDEFWFPSGSAGSLMAEKHPEALNKCLEKTETEIEGPVAFDQVVPTGQFMGVVAMNTETLERIDLTSNAREGRVTWSVPAGTWKIMQFTCVTVGEAGLVDYLDPVSVKKFVDLTYEHYFRRFPEHFGTTIDTAFFDEPTLYRTPNGRTWTPAFNEKFEQHFGFSPVPYYPVLWYDIGPETAAARNALFGFRTTLYAEGFMKVLNDWCRDHKVRLTGHQDQEEIVNQTGIAGDLIKCFKYQDIPGIDQVFQYDRAAKAYKIVSSAAYNYDRPHVVTECYGGIAGMPVENLYREAMDQFAKGINMMVPHAVWYDPAPDRITFEPELSHRTEPYASALPAYNEYIGRLHRILQHGRHVADIAVLYPVATLQAGYRFDVGDRYLGEPTPPEADYMDVGEWLATGIQRDFTFVHPDVLDETCSVEGAFLRLNHEHNFETYPVALMPGATTIHWSNLRKIRQFYEAGGSVISTTRLPHQSAEFGKDAEVRDAIEAIFGATPTPSTQSAVQARVNGAGGRAYFVPQPDAPTLRAVLDDALPVWDVRFGAVAPLPDGHLAYIHKVVDGRNVYFIANSSHTTIDTTVELRGELKLACWDPHTGAMGPMEHTPGNGLTRVPLHLEPVRSMFLVEQ